MKSLKFIEGLKILLNNRGLRYPTLATLLFIVFYYAVLVTFQLPPEIPQYLGTLDIYVIAFLLVITFSIYLLLLTVLMIIPVTRNALLSGRATDIKLLILNIISFVFAVFIPPFIFLIIYLIPFVVWTAFAALFMAMFFWDISERLSDFASEKGRTFSLITFLLFFIVGFIAFGAFYTSFDFSTIPFESTMILLVFPLFIILLPIISILVMLKGGALKQTPFYALLIFALEGYYFMRINGLINLNSTTNVIDAGDTIIQIFLVIYGLGSVAFNGEKLSKLLKLNLEVILVPLLWFKVSSMIVLLAVSDVQIMGYSAIIGNYLAFMFGLLIIGTVYGIYMHFRK
ncbi:MAG: hypothetical protein ACP6IU_04140 [Candidatus Asgardarchaeia archaeon]